MLLPRANDMHQKRLKKLVEKKHLTSAIYYISAMLILSFIIILSVMLVGNFIVDTQRNAYIASIIGCVIILGILNLIYFNAKANINKDIDQELKRPEAISNN